MEWQKGLSLIELCQGLFGKSGGKPAYRRQAAALQS
jgi:hypothetical protein